MTVYFIGAGPFCKIGYTGKESATSRLSELQTASPYTLEILAECPGDLMLEGALHHRFRDCRVRGEWFSLTPELAGYIDDVRRGVVQPSNAAIWEEPRGDISTDDVLDAWGGVVLVPVWHVDDRMMIGFEEAKWAERQARRWEECKGPSYLAWDLVTAPNYESYIARWLRGALLKLERSARLCELPDYVGVLHKWIARVDGRRDPYHHSMIDVSPSSFPIGYDNVPNSAIEFIAEIAGHASDCAAKFLIEFFSRDRAPYQLGMRVVA